MAHKGRHRPAHNERARKSFLARYDMTRSEWADFKKKSPKEAHELRMIKQS